jgi:hypothetical protein
MPGAIASEKFKFDYEFNTPAATNSLTKKEKNSGKKEYKLAFSLIKYLKRAYAEKNNENHGFLEITADWFAV